MGLSLLHVYECKHRKRMAFWLPGAHAPGMLKKMNKLKNVQKNPKKIMHVPDDVTHDRVKFRTETTSYAPCAKMTKFLSEYEIQNFEFSVRILSFLHRAAAMSFCRQI